MDDVRTDAGYGYGYLGLVGRQGENRDGYIDRVPLWRPYGFHSAELKAVGRTGFLYDDVRCGTFGNRIGEVDPERKHMGFPLRRVNPKIIGGK